RTVVAIPHAEITITARRTFVAQKTCGKSSKPESKPQTHVWLLCADQYSRSRVSRRQPRRYQRKNCPPLKLKRSLRCVRALPSSRSRQRTWRGSHHWFIRRRVCDSRLITTSTLRRVAIAW